MPGDIRSFFGAPSSSPPSSTGARGEIEGDAESQVEVALPVVQPDSKGTKRKLDGDAESQVEVSLPAVQVTEESGKKCVQIEVPINSAVRYAEIAEVLDRIEATTKRLEIQQMLREFFVRVLECDPSSLRYAVDLCCCQVAPAFHNVELGVGDGLLKKVVIKVTGRSRQAVQDMYQSLGDLGSVAKEFKSSQSTLFGMKSKPLSLRDVHAQFSKISVTSKADMKQQIIEKMIVAASGAEAKYLIRGLQAKLRIGLAEQTVLTSLAHALCDFHCAAQKLIDPKEVKWSSDSADVKEKAVGILKQVYCELPIYEEILVHSLKSTSVGEMWYDVLRKACTIRAGVPLKPMLAKPTNGVSQVLDRFQDIAFTCEYKYDGERAQIHMEVKKGKPEFKIYSRNSEDNTSKYPDIRAFMPSAVSLDEQDGNYVSSFILDAEAVAYDIKKKALLPFQILSTRARKDVDESDVKIQVIVCVFDILFLNGKSLLETPLTERRELLLRHFKPVENKFCFATSHDGSTTEDIEGFLHKAVEDQCEGLMVKTLHGPDSFYQPARRSLNWLKLKKDYLNNLADSLDLVPIGAYYGKGKRTGTYGAYILAAYDDEEEEFQSITKIGTGFSDKALEEFTEFFKGHISPNKPASYICDMTPDVWFNPAQVWEVRAADLSISPIHKAAIGKVDQGKGIALRFPRFLRIRDDKSCENATNALQVADMYLSQNLTTQTIEDGNDCY